VIASRWYLHIAAIWLIIGGGVAGVSYAARLLEPAVAGVPYGELRTLGVSWL
jgi:hypothetical protein